MAKPKYLVIVESPAKARTIGKFLGPQYTVKASFGHVRDLPKSDLGVDIENDFQPKYVRIKESMKAIKELREAAKKVDVILLASDPDREGEAIGWHVAELLKPAKKPVERIVFNEITKKSIVEAAKHSRPIDENLVNAQQARRVVDRLVGYKVSPFLQWSVRRGLSAGRVQSVAVRMVCDRENEIRAFVPEEYWSIDALLATQKEESFTARLSRIEGEKAKIGSQQEADAILADLRGADYAVASVEKKEVRRNPSPPFITSTLQQEASRKLNFSPRKTMRVAQQLYEGIGIGEEGTVGLITYMRTDSTRLSEEAVGEVRDYISKNFEPAMLPATPNAYKTKKDAQDAHEAIRPTVADHAPDKLKSYLSDDQLRLYTLIWVRFVACQMAPAILDQTTIDVAAGKYTLRATGSIMKFPGFTKVYEETREDSADDKDEKNGTDKLLPDVRERDGLAMRELKPEQHFTKPPPRFSEASLIRALEENGIGRPSTYAPTINTILDRGYVERTSGRLTPTELGEEVNELLVRKFPDILDLEFTARLEDDLDHVEEGKREWHDLVRAFYGDFKRDLDQAQESVVKEILGEEPACPVCAGAMEITEGWYGLFLRCSKHPECDGKVSLRKKQEVIPTEEICEKCGSQMVIRSGRFGKFLACSDYPKCKNTHDVDKEGNKIDSPAKEEPRKTEQKCPDCGAFLLIRKSRRGEEFYGCEKYPKCKFTKPMELGLKCVKPGCEGDLVTKVARRRRFVGCDRYPACDFTIFGQLDRDTACPKCGNSWTMVAKQRGKPAARRCPVPDCTYEEELPDEQNEEAIAEQSDR